MKTEKFAGLVIRAHCVKDATSKDFAQDHMYGWEYVTLSAEEWMQELEKGHTIQPSAYASKPNGDYTHKVEYWQSTHWICADGDNFKGVEFDDEGNDVNPEGLDIWTEENGLSARFPVLKDKVYAVGQSVSSMAKEPPHRRFRLNFLSDEAITTPEHYEYILKTLYTEIPVISPIDRKPTQPVFGNARDGYNKVHIVGNILRLSDYVMPEPKTSTPPLIPDQPNETLKEFLDRHGVSYNMRDTVDHFYVECPGRSKHTGQIQKPQDTYLSESKHKGGKWALYCSHKSCQGLATWDEFKRVHGIETVDKSAYNNSRSNGSAARVMPQNDAPPDPLPVSDVENADIPFPVDVFEGTVFWHYIKAYEGTNETCPAFRFAELAMALGGMFGRKIYLNMQGNYLFPNMFIALVGRSVLARKSASIKASIGVSREYQCETLLVSRSINSAEGIVSEVAEVEDTRLMLYIDEFKQMFVKASQRSGESIIPTLNMAFNGDPLQVKTKDNKLVAENASVSLMGCLTPNWFNDSVTLNSLGGGFINRIAYFLHEQMPLKSRTEVTAPDSKELSKVKKVVREISEIQTATQFRYHKDAEVCERDYYHKKMPAIVDNHDDEVADSSSRTLVHLDKVALMLAWTGNSRQDNTISVDDWYRARMFAEYLEKVNIRLFRDVTFDALTAQEQRVLKALEALGNSATKSELSNKIGRRIISARDLMRILDALVSNEIVAVYQDGRSHRIARIG